MMELKKMLDTYIRARITLIVLVTYEEERALGLIKEYCEQSNSQGFTWDIAEGFQCLTGKGSLPTAKDPLTALEQIDKASEKAIYVLKDFHDTWNNPQIKRKLRSVVQRLKFSKKSIITLNPPTTIPEELKDEVVTIEVSSPSMEDLDEVLRKLTDNPGIKVNLTKLGREKMIQAALGLTTAQAQRVFAKAVVSDGVLDDRDIGLVIEEKKQIIRESKALEYYPFTATFDDVGGLDVLKEWLRLREKAFTQAARDYGLPAPKGIALLGIPGTGKSLTAKMIASLWRLPLLRLDVGALYGSLVGESEERTRRALMLAETVAPCLIWIDEIEKALAHGGLDSGTSARVFSTLLTWMQEKTAPCFIVATANDISMLPPELLRKGRFDDIFFLDLPTFEERKEILTVHLLKRKRVPQDYELDSLSKISEGYVGAEIEQAIIDAMYQGFNEGRDFISKDIEAAIRKQVPLSKSQREVIDSLRNWIREGRAQSASFKEAKEAGDNFVPYQISDPGA
jgi:AAA+ superfamily predicted ATPase